MKFKGFTREALTMTVEWPMLEAELDEEIREIGRREIKEAHSRWRNKALAAVAAKHSVDELLDLFRDFWEHIGALNEEEE